MRNLFCFFCFQARPQGTRRFSSSGVAFAVSLFDGGQANRSCYLQSIPVPQCFCLVSWKERASSAGMLREKYTVEERRDTTRYVRDCLDNDTVVGSQICVFSARLIKTNTDSPCAPCGPLFLHFSSPLCVIASPRLGHVPRPSAVARPLLPFSEFLLLRWHRILNCPCVCTTDWPHFCVPSVRSWRSGSSLLWERARGPGRMDRQAQAPQGAKIEES